MSAKITTNFGEPVPPAPRHSVTVHMGGWDTVEQFGSDPPSVIVKYKNTYPRLRPHRDIAQLSAAVLEHIGHPDMACLVFSSLQSAQQCVEFAVSSKRDNGIDKKPLAADEIKIRAFVAKDPFLAVIFPADKLHVVSTFWSITGAGVSSRFGEANLGHLDQITEIPISEFGTDRSKFDGPDHQTLRTRILSFLERAPLHPDQQPRVSPSDIYLYQSGMASIFKPQMYMLNHYHGASVLFGVAFMDTITALEQFGPESKFFGVPTDQALAELEDHLRESRVHGRKVQSIWVEFPANPLLVSPDITRLRKLATEYDVVLGIDDTIGSWANIDVISMADILITSLTKSFNGYADAIGGVAILNPASPKYPELKPLFDAQYVPEFYVDDARVMERNSRDYLARTAKLNTNASALVDYLHGCAQDPASVVRQVHYPSINPSGVNYKRFMRPATPDFTPGYGCLLSVELDNLATTQVFYENLNIHKSVHLGAPFTLAFAYTMCTYKRRLEWAAENGLRPTQIRVSVGLEDTSILLDEFRIAVEAANRAKNNNLN